MALPSFKILLFHLAVTIFCRSSSYRQQAVSVRSATLSQFNIISLTYFICNNFLFDVRDKIRNKYMITYSWKIYLLVYSRSLSNYENKTVNLDDLIRFNNNNECVVIHMCICVFLCALIMQYVHANGNTD